MPDDRPRLPQEHADLLNTLAADVAAWPKFYLPGWDWLQERFSVKRYAKINPDVSDRKSVALLLLNAHSVLTYEAEPQSDGTAENILHCKAVLALAYVLWRRELVPPFDTFDGCPLHYSRSPSRKKKNETILKDRKLATITVFDPEAAQYRRWINLIEHCWKLLLGVSRIVEPAMLDEPDPTTLNELELQLVERVKMLAVRMPELLAHTPLGSATNDKPIALEKHADDVRRLYSLADMLGLRERPPRPMEKAMTFRHAAEYLELLLLAVRKAVDASAKPADEGDYPLRHGYTSDIPADQPTIDAVRKVIKDWDGRNWEAVRAVLRDNSEFKYPDTELDKMTRFRVRMIFAAPTPPMMLKIGSTYTAAESIVMMNASDGEEKPALVGAGEVELQMAAVNAPDGDGQRLADARPSNHVGYAGVGDLAKQFGIVDPKAIDAFKRKLYRARDKNPGDANLWRETDKNAPRDSQYLFNAADHRVIAATKG